MARYYGIAKHLAGTAPASKRAEYVRGLLLCIGGVLALSPESLLIRLIETEYRTLLFWRGTFSAISVFIFIVVISGRQTWPNIRAIGRPGILIAFVQAVQGITFVMALMSTTVANVLVIMASAPIFSAIFSRVFLKETVERNTWIAAFTVFLGIFVLFFGNLGSGSLPGDLLALLTAWLIAANFVLIRKAKVINMIPATCVSNILVAIIMLLAGAQPGQVVAGDIVWLMLVGFVVVPVAISCITLGPRYLSASNVSLIMLLETPLAPLLVWLVLGEQPPAATITAGGIIVGTLFLHTLVTMRQQGR